MNKNEIDTVKDYLISRLTEINAEIWERAGKKNHQARSLSDDEKWKNEVRSSTLNTIAYALERELDSLAELSIKGA